MMTRDEHSELSPRAFAVSVVERLQQAGHQAVFAGGCVRDMLLAQAGRSNPDDYDVATDATPQRVRELFGKKSTLSVGESFGVIIVLGPKVDGQHLQVEVATFRAEGEYSDGRRPDNVVYCTAEEDAARRDFTINGMFYDPIADVVLDFVGGQEDLESGVVRAIGDPHARIAEDKLRMLRAIRFTARFGFALDPATRAAIEEHAGEITVVSWERITQEMSKVLTHRSRRYGVELMRDTGLLFQVFPELAPDDDAAEERLDLQLDALDLLGDVTLETAALGTATFETALAVLVWTGPVSIEMDPSSVTRTIARRMKLSNAQRATASWLASNRGELRDFADRSLAERKVILADDRAECLIALDRAEARARGACEEGIDAAERYWRSTPMEVLDPPPLITGDDLIAAGLTPGMRFKILLRHYRKLQLDEQLSTREDALARLESAVNSDGA